eukprot:2711010-Amphidinium_carterae.1
MHLKAAPKDILMTKLRGACASETTPPAPKREERYGRNTAANQRHAARMHEQTPILCVVEGGSFM